MKDNQWTLIPDYKQAYRAIMMFKDEFQLDFINVWDIGTGPCFDRILCQNATKWSKNTLNWRKYNDISQNCCNFALLNFSAELLPRTRFYEQNQISIGAAHHSADSTIADLGL